MSIEPSTKAHSLLSSRFRFDSSETEPALADLQWVRAVALALLAGFFVVFGGGNLDLGPIESKLGLAAEETLSPLGQVMGGWEPSVWPGTLAPSLVWAWGEGGFPTSASVRWPSAIAGILVGFVLSRSVAKGVGGRAGILVGLAWFGSLALMDRSAGAGIDLITAFGTIAALERLLRKGSDLITGFWGALAVVCGGWPPLALIVLTTIVIGRSNAMVTWRLLLPSLLALVAWSAWALSTTTGEAWGAAIALPLTQKPAWFLIPGVLALGLPWTPFILLQASRSVRGTLTPQGRTLAFNWLQIAIAALIAGTLIPGLAGAAKVPALAGLAVVAGIIMEAAVFGQVSPKVQKVFLLLSLGLVLVWFTIAIAAGGYLAAAISYYRALAIVLILCGEPVVAVAWYALEFRDRRLALLTVVAVAVCLKFAHWGYYVPEWNYRRSQGPWGRAIGQWVPPRWPIYTTHTWNSDFAFALGRPVRQLVSDRHLRYEPGEARFVLLLDSEYEEWSKEAPPLTLVTKTQDEQGRIRVLARTAGPLPWTRR